MEMGSAFSLTGRTALITGASGGIGAAVAAFLDAAGARCVLSGTNIARLEATAAVLGRDPCILPCDLSEAESVASLPQRTIDAAGGLDILVSNAGLTRDALAVRMRQSDWQAVMDINLRAFFLLCQKSLRAMLKQKHGRIIGIGSVVAATGNPGQANYCAAKAGMIGMAKAIAAEVAQKGVTVNIVAPGFIDTAMTRRLTEQQREAIAARIPMRRMGSADDIAAACVYLASDAAAYVTGQTLHVNGGMAMV